MSANTPRKRAAGDQPTIMDAFKKKRANGDTSKPRSQRAPVSAITSKQAEGLPKTPSTAAEPEKMTSQTAVSNDSKALQITESTGDIFAAPNNTLLIHACNCQASWAAGIAKVFKQHYPAAYSKYATYCKKLTPDQLFGTSYLITPADDIFSDHSNENANTTAAASEDEGFAEGHGGDDGDKATHFVGCLFTSHHYGKRKDTPTKIVEATGPAMEDLLQKVSVWNESVSDDKKIKEVRMCKINSGLFNVPWEKTREVLEAIEVDAGGVGTVKVISLEE